MVRKSNALSFPKQPSTTKTIRWDSIQWRWLIHSDANSTSEIALTTRKVCQSRDWVKMAGYHSSISVITRPIIWHTHTSVQLRVSTQALSTRIIIILAMVWACSNTRTAQCLMMTGMASTEASNSNCQQLSQGIKVTSEVEVPLGSKLRKGSVLSQLNQVTSIWRTIWSLRETLIIRLIMSLVRTTSETSISSSSLHRLLRWFQISSSIFSNSWDMTHSSLIRMQGTSQISISMAIQIKVITAIWVVRSTWVISIQVGTSLTWLKLKVSLLSANKGLTSHSRSSNRKICTNQAVCKAGKAQLVSLKLSRTLYLQKSWTKAVLTEVYIPNSLRMVTHQRLHCRSPQNSTLCPTHILWTARCHVYHPP